MPPAALYHLHEFTRYPGVRIAATRHKAVLLYDAHDFYPSLVRREELSRKARLVRVADLAVERRCASAATAMVTVSAGVAELYQEWCGRLPVVLRNTHDARLDRPPNRSLREQLDIPPTDTVVVTLGQRRSTMGVEAALEALASLPTNTHWVFIGNGYGAPERAAARQLAVDDRAHFLAPVPPFEVVPLVADGDIGAILLEATNANYANALPNRFFQLLSAGLPLMFPALPQLLEVSAGRGIGVVIDPSDATALVTAVGALSDGPTRAATRERVQELAREMTWEAEEHILEELVRACVPSLASGPP
jgi:glycosyltransferase involved in cell wall biosynthesis